VRLSVKSKQLISMSHENCIGVHSQHAENGGREQ